MMTCWAAWHYGEIDFDDLDGRDRDLGAGIAHAGRGGTLPG